MHCIPPTTETVSRNSLHETNAWLAAEERETQQRARPRCGHSPAYHPSACAFRFALEGMAETKHRPLIRIGSLSTG